MPEQLLEGQARFLEAAGPDLVGVGSFDLAHGPERLRDDAPAVAREADQLRTAVAFVWSALEVPSLHELIDELERSRGVARAEQRANAIRSSRGAGRTARHLPQEVLVPPLPGRGRPRKNMALARPTGFERADAINIRILIDKASETLIARETA
jgi:hypothetical protein